MRRRCGRLRCRRVDNALLIHRYEPPANTTLKDEPPCPATAAPKCRAPRKKGGQIYLRLPASCLASIAALSSAQSTGFALHGESLDSLRSPFGPAFGCYSATLRISCLARESNQREDHPDIRVWPAARLPSLQCCSGGRLHPWPFMRGHLALSPHPCGSSPYATPPLGLLTGIGVRVARRFERHLFGFFAGYQATPTAPSGG